MSRSTFRIIFCLLATGTICVLSSCVTLLSEPSKTMTVHIGGPATVTVDGVTANEARNNKASFLLKKGKRQIPITVVTDSTTQTLTIQTQSTLVYYGSLAYFGVGILERNNPKRYSFPSNIYLIPGDTLRYKTARPTSKGEVMIHISIPYGNAFYFQPKNEYAKTNAGFLGFATGVEYYHHDKQFLSLTLGAAMNFLAPVPAPVHYGGIRKQMTTVWAGLTNNHKIDHLSLGYGLAFNRNNWTGPSDADSTKKVSTANYAGGLIFNSYWRVSRNFDVGLIYRPSFIGFGTNTSRYEHLLSVDLAWKIPLTPYRAPKSK